LLQVPELKLAEVGQRLGFAIHEDKPLVLVIQHVISTEINDAYRQMRITLEAIADLGLTAVLSYGTDRMLRKITPQHEFTRSYERLLRGCATLPAWTL